MQSRRSLSPLAWVLVVAAVFFALFLAISGVVFLNRSGSSGSAKSKSTLFSGGGDGEVGVIELNGVIMDSKRFIKTFDRFEKDSNVKAIVVRLNSPGGSVAPSQEIYQAVKASKKPVIASMGSVAASGAYYVACGAKLIYANAGTITGSIGVIMEFANLEKLYEWAKVKRYVIKTGKFKDVGSEFREMAAEERALLQTMIDNVLGQFKQAVAESRQLKLEQVTKLADGRIFSGEQALEAKLIDEVGSLHDAVLAAGKLAGIKGEPDVVYPEKPQRKILEWLLSDGGGDEDAESSGSVSVGHGLDALVQRLVGRALPVGAVAQPPGIYWLWHGPQG